VGRSHLGRAHRFVTRFVNPITLRIVGSAPDFGIVTHQGRTSGRTYRTPVNVFRKGTSYLFVLTYGSDAQRIKNVLPAGKCDLHTRGHDLRLVEPRVVVDATLGFAPGPVRRIGRMAGVTEYATMTLA
jgi:deazaflavin-dependent oxidoreductase (nitroreductase family)